MIRNIATITAVALLAAVTAALFIYPAISGLHPVAIRSSSMQPTIPTAALVYVREQSTYEEGDIVTFRAQDAYITHRLLNDITGNGDLYSTIGDANTERDAYFLKTENILGKAVSYLPYLGFVQLALTGPVPIFIALVALSIILFPMILRQHPNSSAANAETSETTSSNEEPAADPTTADAQPPRARSASGAAPLPHEHRTQATADPSSAGTAGHSA